MLLLHALFLLLPVILALALCHPGPSPPFFSFNIFAARVTPEKQSLIIDDVLTARMMKRERGGGLKNKSTKSTKEGKN